MASSASLRLLILGGTTEASALARLLVGEAWVAPVLSLAGRTRLPVLPPIPSRIGGFGGASGLADYLRAGRIGLLIDATHPFAARISANAEAAAEIAGVPRLVLQRPCWTPVEGDRWTPVASVSAAAAALGETPRRVFLTIGRHDLPPFRAAPQHRYLIRSVDAPAPDLLPPLAEILTGRGPFDIAAETTLMRQRAIDALVTKNSGGDDAKLRAARTLGLPVIMVDRPAAPIGDTVADATAAMAWLRAHAGTGTDRGA
jgi:precorrin-6A/cobalt-precorrin-6A reductase